MCQLALPLRHVYIVRNRHILPALQQLNSHSATLNRPLTVTMTKDTDDTTETSLQDPSHGAPSRQSTAGSQASWGGESVPDSGTYNSLAHPFRAGTSVSKKPEGNESDHDSGKTPFDPWKERLEKERASESTVVRLAKDLFGRRT